MTLKKLICRAGGWWKFQKLYFSKKVKPKIYHNKEVWGCGGKNNWRNQWEWKFPTCWSAFWRRLWRSAASAAPSTAVAAASTWRLQNSRRWEKAQQCWLARCWAQTELSTRDALPLLLSRRILRLSSCPQHIQVLPQQLKKLKHTPPPNNTRPIKIIKKTLIAWCKQHVCIFT